MTDVSSGPFFTGLLVHRDPKFAYSFFVADGWHRLEMEHAEHGVIYAPDPAIASTSFSAEARDLGTDVGADDLPALREGMLRGIGHLPGSRLEWSEAEAIGRLLTLEARHTYGDPAQPRGSRSKRWVRLLYQGSTQVRLVAQGATVSEFDYWMPMFYQSMRTFRFGDWAADMGAPGWAEDIGER